MTKPKFSIILPTHNGENRIDRAISSVLIQTFTDYELIIVCDACTDNTEQHVKNNMDSHIRVIHTNCKRDGLARNTGLDAAHGSWILFLDDDDWFLHEYCLELLAENVGKHGEDVLDFAFIWRDKGYKIPSKDECFVMTWCRAWRRSFIGANRFDDSPYGSDKHFFQKMIQNNPDVNVYFWNTPIYYYNYMREGSLSWMEKQKKLLDIIITHHDEPWEIGKTFFDMLALQYDADLDKVSVTIVQDGKENALPWNDLLSHYPFKVDVLTIQHSGISTARNVGFQHGTGDWVMFCDFDDFFADVCTLSMILQNFPTDEYDIIWGKYLRECRWYKGNTFLNKVDDPNFLNTDNKIYRRKFLEEKNIRFPNNMPLHCDTIFNALVLTETKPWRIVHITTDFYMYVKRYRKDGTRHMLHNCMNMIHSLQKREFFIANELKKRGYDFEYRKHIAAIVAHEYYSIYNPDTEAKLDFTPGFIEFYKDYCDIFHSVSQTDFDVILSDAEAEAINIIQNLYNEQKLEYYFVNDTCTFYDWIKDLDDMLQNEWNENGNEEADQNDQNENKWNEQNEQNNNEPIYTSPDDYAIIGTDPENYTPKRKNQNERIVVYCGTQNTYNDMLTSAKSLLMNTPVDHVYFLTEDDTFPYELPDIITNINVKNQTYFTPDGPNYNNAWTYMCMIRAAYPELFPQHSTVLSLDIDVVIKDNVSDLWNYDLSDYYIAGVEEPQRKQSAYDLPYINFGVVLMNLDKLRADNMQDKIIHHLNTQRCGCPEQDAFNKLCAGHILTIPNDYNVSAYSHITGHAQHEHIIHYAGQKFWRHYTNVKQYAEIDFNTIMNRQNELKRQEQEQT